jgi:hypothetical protein
MLLYTITWWLKATQFTNMKHISWIPLTQTTVKYLRFVSYKSYVI